MPHGHRGCIQFFLPPPHRTWSPDYQLCLGLWLVSKPTKAFASCLPNCSSPAAHLRSFFSPMKVCLQPFVPIHAFSLFSSSHSQKYFLICVSHRWFRAHNKLSHSCLGQVICHFVVSSSALSGDPEQIYNSFLYLVVQYIVAFLGQF